MICIQCNKNKTLKFYDPREENKKNPICTDCKGTTTMDVTVSYRKGRKIKATCMRCRKKYLNDFKWGICDFCKNTNADKTSYDFADVVFHKKE